MRRVRGVRGASPAAVATEHPGRGRHAAKGADGRRRRSVALVPGSLVGFFALMAVVFGFLASQSWQSSRPWHGGTAVVDGSVVELVEPGFTGRSAGEVIVRYVVSGSEYRLETGRDPGDHFFRLNDVLPVEYVVAGPARARAVWAVESARADLHLWTVVSGLCAVLSIATGLGYLVGRRRLSRR